VEVDAALRSRRTVRGFTRCTVPREILEAVLGDALHTPSWANTQPWEIYVAGGEVLDAIRAASVERTIAKVPSSPDVPFPAAWPDICRTRTKELTAGRAAVRGLGSEDPLFHHDFLMANRRFFDAPIAVYLCMDRMLGSWSIFDLGAMCQSITLAALHHGVESAIAINLVVYPDLLRTALKIPDELLIVIGIALGYADQTSPEDAFRSMRRPLGDAVTFVGVS
jgi:nitroreductase